MDEREREIAARWKAATGGPWRWTKRQTRATKDAAV